MSVAAVVNILGKRRKSLSRSGSGWALTVRRSARRGRWVVFQQNSLMVAHQISLSMGASIA
jgi:hypothetical protein